MLYFFEAGVYSDTHTEKLALVSSKRFSFSVGIWYKKSCRIDVYTTSFLRYVPAGLGLSVLSQPLISSLLSKTSQDLVKL